MYSFTPLPICICIHYKYELLLQIIYNRIPVNTYYSKLHITELVIWTWDSFRAVKAKNMSSTGTYAGFEGKSELSFMDFAKYLYPKSIIDSCCPNVCLEKVTNMHFMLSPLTHMHTHWNIFSNEIIMVCFW